VCVIDIGSERVLDLSQPLHSQIICRSVGKRPAVYLRYEEPNPMGGFIRIYPKGLRLIYCIISNNTIIVLILIVFVVFQIFVFVVCLLLSCKI